MKTKTARKQICHDFEPKCDYVSTRFNDDSMKGAGIFDGSIVVVHKQRTATDGDIVAVILNKTLYLRRYRLFGDTVMLVPENVNFVPIPVLKKDDFIVLGKVVQICTYLD